MTDRKVYKVGEEHRTNPLSKKPTDNTITVHEQDCDKEYSNVHYPEAFVKAIMKTNQDWVSISLNGRHWGSNPNHPINQQNE